MYRHILIATDGSDLAEHAVTDGLSLAKSVGAKATVIMVVEVWLGSGALMQPWSLQELGKYNEETKKKAGQRAELRGKCGQAGRRVLRHDFKVEVVQPYKAIIATAADRGCDLIVMASHGHSGLSAVVLGSVTNKVLTHTKIPVLVVR